MISTRPASENSECTPRQVLRPSDATSRSRAPGAKMGNEWDAEEEEKTDDQQRHAGKLAQNTGFSPSPNWRSIQYPFWSSPL